MDESANSSHWLHRYGNADHYQWRSIFSSANERSKNGGMIYHRPLGLVESAFDSDGRYFEGRADMNLQLDLEIKSTLNDEDFRERVLLAWTALRCRHLLVQAKAVKEDELGSRAKGLGEGGGELHFAVDAPGTVQQAVEDAGEHLVFLADHFKSVDHRDFWTHSQNTARIIDPSRALVKLFVLPLEPLPSGHQTLRLLMVCSHQVCDGIAMSIWLRSLISSLNLSFPDLRAQITYLLDPTGIKERLPPAQEALYPPIPGSRARQRWFWLLTRILRHVRRPLPAAFPNPLRRAHPRKTAIPLSPIYHPVLNYTRAPHLNTFPCTARTSARATHTLHRLCREARTSIGAGCFALAATILMEFHERQHPCIPLSARQPFIAGFPLNPRAFFNHNPPDPDSLMLAFSDGIQLPFLPRALPVAARIKLLARRAHAQLTTFQKRAGTSLDTAGFAYMSARGAGRLLPVHYLFSIERWLAKLPEDVREGMGGGDPQGAYAMRPNTTGQTCGVSSVGSKVGVLRRGMFSLGEGEEFAADFRSSHAAVRPRDDEFLVGIGGDDESTIGMNTSLDANAIDPVLAAEFCQRFERILEEVEVDGVEARTKL